MSLNARCLLPVIMLLLASCGSETSTAASLAQPAATQPPATELSTINWQTLGCAEPAPFVVQSSDALETDVGLAAESMAETFDLTIDEAKRRLRLQEVLGQAMGAVRSAEGDRVARSEMQHQPSFAAVVTLTGTADVSDKTREVLCRTADLVVRLGARFSEDELRNEIMRLAPLITDSNPGLTTFGPSDGELVFGVIDDASRDQLDALLSTLTDYPYSIGSLGLPPLVLDPQIPFPLIDTTGRPIAGVGLSGTLTIDGPCVYLNDTLVILPARETSWDPATGVLNTGSGDLRSGDVVTGGGSRYSEDALDNLAQPPDPSCRLGGGVFSASFAPIDPNATPAPVPPGVPFNGAPAAAGVPPEPPDAARFELEPRNPQAGETFTATFEETNSRGGYFFLRRWLGSDWSEPRFVLESGSGPSDEATAIEMVGEGPLMNDYGVGGSGPDPLVMPAVIEPGQWRLCTANAAPQICTQITVFE